MCFSVFRNRNRQCCEGSIAQAETLCRFLFITSSLFPSLPHLITPMNRSTCDVLRQPSFCWHAFCGKGSRGSLSPRLRLGEALAWTMCGCCPRDATEDRPPHNAPVRRRAPPGQCACMNNLTLAGVAVVHSGVKLIPRSCDYLNPRSSASIPRTTSSFKFHQ